MVRLGVVGCREMAEIEEVASRLKRGQITAVADGDTRAATATGIALDVSVVAGSLDELIENHWDALDAVVIRSSVETHASLVKKVAEAGKHVMVDSPLGLSALEASAAAEACSKAGVRLMVGNPSRHTPKEQIIKQSLSDGRLGAPGVLRLHRWEHTKNTDRAGILQTIVNDIDLCHWIFEAIATEVYCVGRRIGGLALDQPDFIQIHLGFPDGGMALIDYAATLPLGAGYSSVSLIGSTGGVYGDDAHNTTLAYQGGHPSAIGMGYGNVHVLGLLQEFIDAIEDGREPDNSGGDGKYAILVAEAAVDSINSGRAARLKGGRYESA